MHLTAPRRVAAALAATAALTFGTVGTGGAAPASGPSSAPSSADRAAAPSAVGAKRAGWTRVFQDNFGNKERSQQKWFNSAPRPLKTYRCWAFGQPAGTSVVYIKPRRAWDTGELSCRMRTVQFFGGATYRFSARVKFHQEAGTLSSFWVTGDGPNEIDVIENTGKKDGSAACVPKKVRDTVSRDDESAPRMYGLMQNVYHSYTPRTGHRNCVPQGVAHPKYSGFHVVSAVWVPGSSVTFSIDGKRSAKFGAKWSRTSPVAALLTNKSAAPDGKPGFVVDWVKVWKKD